MKGEEIIIPPLFRCPISLDLFKDPVTLSTGQTYDRSCIEKWLDSGNLTCPVTMQKLQDSSMVPNHTLSHLIEQWIHSNGPNYCLELFTGTDFSMSKMKQIIECDESTLENKLRVLEKVQSLSQELPTKNYCLIKLNFFGLLFESVLRNAESLVFQESLKVVEKSLLCAIELMPFSELATLNMLKQDCECEKFIVLFQKGSFLIKKSLCLLIEAISSSSETWPLCEKLGKSVELVQELVHLIQDKSEAVEAGIRAISSLSLMESNLENLVINGAVQGLIAYILSVGKEKGSLASMAISTIENLLGVESAKEAILNDPCGVKAIVKMVFRVSDHEGSESAVNSLLIICSDSKSAREEVIVCGVLTQVLFLLQSQCSVRSKNKARLLLKLLRSM